MILEQTMRTLAFFLLDQSGQFQLQPPIETEPVPLEFRDSVWYALLFVVLSTLLFFVILYYRSYKSKAYRREAIQVIDVLSSGNTVTSEDSQLLEVQVTLKRVAIQSYGREKVAALYGREWLQFLENTGKDTAFTKFEAIWAGGSAEEGPLSEQRWTELIQVAKKWIRTHA